MSLKFIKRGLAYFTGKLEKLIRFQNGLIDMHMEAAKDARKTRDEAVELLTKVK